MEKLNTFRNRLLKLGIETTYFANYPWVYIDTINDVKVTETFGGEHGFTVGFRNNGFEFTSIDEIFKLIRKYSKTK